MRFEQLIKQLQQGQIAPVYLWYGSEDYLRRLAVERLQQALFPGVAQSWNISCFTREDASYENIAAAAEELTWDAETRLVIADITRLMAKATEREAVLLRYLETPAPTTCLVLIWEDKLDQRRKLVKRIETIGVMVEFNPLKGMEFYRWLQKEAGMRGYGLAADAAAYLFQNSGGHLERAVHELDKVCLFLNQEQEISLTTVQQVVSRSLAAGVFALVDAAADEKPALSLEILDQLLLLGENPGRILALIARQVRLLLEVQQLQSSSLPDTTIAVQLGLPRFVIDKLCRQTRLASTSQLIDLLANLLEYDHQIKTGGNAPAILEMAILGLAGYRTNPR